MSKGNQIINVVVKIPFDHDVHHGIKDGAFLHSRFRGRGFDITFYFFRDFFHAVHVDDLLPDFLLIVLDSSVRIHFTGIKIGHDLNVSFAEDVPFEDITERRLGVHREDKHLFPFFGQIIGCCRGKGGLAESPLSPVHDISPVRVFIKNLR